MTVLSLRDRFSSLCDGGNEVSTKGATFKGVVPKIGMCVLAIVALHELAASGNQKNVVNDFFKAHLFIMYISASQSCPMLQCSA
jgi:hypothetical protein